MLHNIYGIFGQVRAIMVYLNENYSKIFHYCLFITGEHSYNSDEDEPIQHPRIALSDLRTPLAANYMNEEINFGNVTNKNEFLDNVSKYKSEKEYRDAIANANKANNLSGMAVNSEYENYITYGLVNSRKDNFIHMDTSVKRGNVSM
jgi:hypothetical protein